MLSTVTVTSTSATPNYLSNVTIAQLNPANTAVTLRDAINAADNTGGNNTIALQSNVTYAFASAPTSPSGNITTTQAYWWYGPSALPVIDSTITIQGNGAVLDVTGGAAIRFFYVSNGISNTTTPAGNLTLENLTLENGVARGGNGTGGGGGGLGAGGAILNQGALTLNGVTLNDDTAIGGSGGGNTAGGAGGGMGGNANASGVGGGFGAGWTPGTGFGGLGGAGDNSGDAGGGGGFLTTANGAAGSGGSGGAGGGQGGLGGDGVNDGGAGFGGAGAGSGTGGHGGDFGAGGAFGTGTDAGGGGGGVGGGGGLTSSQPDNFSGAGGFGGGGGGGSTAGNNGGFGGGGGDDASGGFGAGNGSGNTNTGGGGAGLGGAIFNMGAAGSANLGQLTIVNSTFNADAADGGSGGDSTAEAGSGLGGAIFNLNGAVTVTNATLAGNSVAAGSTGTAPTVTPAGGAIYNQGFGKVITTGAAVSTGVSLVNDILANSTGGTDLANLQDAGSATVTATAPNIVLTQSGTGISGSGIFSTSSVALALSSLANNGGPSDTQAILATSSAYGVGTSTGAPTIDQRGVTRNSPPSLGAYDFASGPTISSVSPQVGPIAGATPITITGAGFTGATGATIGGEALTSFTVVNNTTITGDTPAGSVAGPADVVVSNGTSATLTGGFTYGPVVTPDSTVLTMTSTTLTITGSGFDSNMANDEVVFSGGATGSIFAATNNSLSVDDFTGLVGGPLSATVTVNGAASSPSQVATVHPAVSSNTSNLSPTATTLTIDGFGFDSNAANDSVAFSGGSGTVSAAMSTTLNVTGLTGLVAGPMTAIVTVNGTSSSPAVEVAVVEQSPAITSVADATFAGGTAGSFTVTATGNPTPTFSLTGAPGWLSIGSTTGILAGTPPILGAGPYTFTVHAGNGVTPNATQPFTLTVNQAPAITSAMTMTFTLGSAGSFIVSSTGFPVSTLTESGALPAGVTFTDNGNDTATISGTPTGTAGAYSLNIAAANGVSPAASQSFTLTVGQTPTLTTLTINAPANTVNQGASIQLSATGTDQFGSPITLGQVSWSLDSGSTGSIDQSGLFTAGATGETGGSAIIRATSDGQTTTLTLAVNGTAPVITVSAYAQLVSSTGNTGILHVQGMQDGTDANLIYTWSIISQPPAVSGGLDADAASTPPLAQFSINGSNSAQNTSVTFLASGQYTLQVTASNGTQSATSQVQVTATVKPSATQTTQVSGVQALGDTGSITGFLVTFNGPVDPTTAQDVRGYRILRPSTISNQGNFWQQFIGNDAKAGMARATYTLSSAVYDSQTDSVTLTLASPMPVKNGVRVVEVMGTGPQAVLDANNQPIDGDANGTVGGNFAYGLSMSVAKRVTYKTVDGDTVTLSLRGPGKILTLIPAGTKTPVIDLIGTDSLTSILTGKLHKGRKSPGYAVLAELNGSANATIQLGSEFHVNQSSGAATV